MRRLADISAELKKPFEEVFGMYLQAYDQYPQTDIGKYSYVEAMLMDYASKTKGEQERRTQIVDEKIKAIQDPEMRYRQLLSPPK